MCADIVRITTPDFTSSHVFSSDDLTATFDGLTQASLPDGDTTIIDTTATPKTTLEGVDLYPVDSEFGYIVTDFVGAEVKEMDGLYTEGWIGDLHAEGGEQMGVMISNEVTDTFKTPALLGTWLAGLGGNTVKASTEHYVVMQNVLSDQKFPGDPDALYPLDDNLIIVGGDYDGMYVSDALLLSGDVNGDGAVDIKDVLEPNETEITQNIAYSTDYSVTLKDDGKLLYRWGNTIKKPNDMRLDIKLDLPDDWTAVDPDTGLIRLFKVTAAELAVDHTITNNPNDQIRPEDLENEAAIGQLPGYTIDPAYTGDGGAAREVWLSDGDYYAGDGTFYPAGTILRDAALAAAAVGTPLDQIGALSSDLVNGFTNAWYTTMDREPFEAEVDEFGDYIIGPRWRLQPDKYGQDLPSVVIPADPSLPPPPTKDEVKYEVGEDTTTVINLLDWGAAVSPLSFSAGYHNNSGTTSGNGVNMTNDLDVAFYVKGDIKPATLYDTTLYLTHEEIEIFGANESIVGAEGDDYLVGQGGNTFTGGAGNDLFVVSYGANSNWALLQNSVISDFTIGEDMLSLIDLNVNDLTFDRAVDQRVDSGNLVISLAGYDLVTLTGVTEELDMEEDFILINRSVDDTIVGTMSDDFLVGDAYDNTIFGLAGNDTIYGLEGDDTLAGNAGKDVIYGNEDNDVIRGGDHADRLFGGEGDDYILGGRGRDTVRMGDGNDTFEDAAQFDSWGNDTVYGGRGDDTFLGLGGNDVYDGGEGMDSLRGGMGDDTLTGGDDADVFMFSAGGSNGADVITDFELGLDLVEVSGAIFTDLTISDAGGNALVSWSDGSALLLGVLDTALAEADFSFV